MKEKKRIAIYPFTSSEMSLLQYINNDDGEYIVTTPISLNGTGLNNRDASVADNRQTTGLSVSNDIISVINDFDILLIVSNDISKKASANIFYHIIKAAENKKDIICTLEFSPLEVESIEKICKENSINFKLSTNKSDLFIENNNVPKSLQIPSVPVVFVGDLMSDCGSQDVLLTISSEIKKCGYNVSVIGANIEFEEFNLHPHPSFLKSKNTQEINKILYYNLFVNHISHVERSDIIIVQLPGGMLKYNHILTNNFGIFPYMISQALQPDYFILSSPYGTFNEDFFVQISEDFTYRFGFPINAVSISNMMLDYQESIEKAKPCYLKLPYLLVEKTIGKYNAEITNGINAFNRWNEENMKALCKDVLSVLCGEVIF